MLRVEVDPSPKPARGFWASKLSHEGRGNVRTVRTRRAEGAFHADTRMGQPRESRPPSKHAMFYTGTQRGAPYSGARCFEPASEGSRCRSRRLDLAVCAERTDVPPLLAALSRVARRHGVAHLRVMPYWANEMWRALKRAAEARFQDVQTFDGSHVVTLRLDIRRKTNKPCRR